MTRISVSTLFQTDHWVDNSGRHMLIESLDAHDASNIAHSLIRRLDGLNFLLELWYEDHHVGARASLSVTDLLDLPLLRALRERLDPRDPLWLRTPLSIDPAIVDAYLDWIPEPGA